MEMQEWDGLQRRYPAWRIRQTSGGESLIATRMDRRALTDKELGAGLCMTLVEDTPDRLVRALVTQTELERYF
jgi:hypothetical protein